MWRYTSFLKHLGCLFWLNTGGILSSISLLRHLDLGNLSLRFWGRLPRPHTRVLFNNTLINHKTAREVLQIVLRHDGACLDCARLPLTVHLHVCSDSFLKGGSVLTCTLMSEDGIARFILL